MRDRVARHADGRLCIDLGAIVRNYLAIVEHAAPAKVGAVVKADAYGLGAARVSGALAGGGCRLFFVAQLEEALDLRPVLPCDAALVVMNGLPRGSEAACADAGVIPALNSTYQARAWLDAAKRAGRRLPAALQVNSGMMRLGLDREDLVALLEDMELSNWVEMQMVMSHLACADIPDHRANADQLAHFHAMADLAPAVPRTIANSSGIFLSSHYWCDIVRAGVALYGGAPGTPIPNPMHPVVRLDARVIQIRSVPAGSGIGYGHDYRCDRTSFIATIGVGYADGLPRTLGNRGAGWFDGNRLPIVGRVSMDSITLDVSDVARGRLREGDWVELIGPSQSVDELASDAGTISYEILTSLGPRHDRCYLPVAASEDARTAGRQ